MASPSSSSSSSLDLSPPVATVDEFAEFLSQEPDWYTLGVFLGAPVKEMVRIGQIRTESIMRRLIEVYIVLESRGNPPSWDHIATALKRINRQDLADRVHEIYILPHLQRLSSESKKEDYKSEGNLSSNSSPVDTTVSIVKPTNSSDAIGSDEQSAETVKAITSEYTTLSEKFTIIKSRVRRAFKTSPNIDVDELQHVVRDQCGIEPQRHATVDKIFDKLQPCISILNFQIILFLVKNLLKNKKVIQKQVASFEQDIDRFKSSAKMFQLVDFIKEKQVIDGNSKMMQLKVREFWTDFTFKQFEKMVNKILGTLYAVMSQMRVGTGCICISWVIPGNINATNIALAHSLEFIQLIGIISLHIGSDVIYNIEGEGCETIEAAMLQAIELKNTRAIELLLAMGCNPEVATYTGDNAVTTIVNIRESKKPSVDHVCIIGHNEHVEAIVDPTSKPAECSSCIINKTMNKQLFQEIDGTLHRERTTLHQEQTTLYSQTDELQLTVKTKDREIEELTELQMKDKGRVFYKCSKGDGEGKCNFFLWADQSDETASSPSHSSPSWSQSFSSPITPSFSNNSSKPSQSSGRQPGFLFSTKGRGNKGRGSSSRREGGVRGGVNKSQLCKCNLPVAQRIVKQGSNSGRPFINCPKPREEQCEFFEFTDEISKRGGANLMGKRSSSMVHGDNDGPGTKKRAPPTCSICHIPGHTKKTCP